MAVAQLNTSTLSEAITTDTIEFAVNSTTNILAGYMLALGKELLNVVSVPVSGRVVVQRGWQGTKAQAHANGRRFFIGTPDQYKSFAGTVILGEPVGLVGSAGVFPDYLLPGLQATDGYGNVYVLVDSTMTSYTGVTVLISNDGLFTASVLTGGSQGSVGVLVEECTSNQYAWAQIYGYMAAAQDATATSAADSTYVPTAATSVSTPAAGMAAIAHTSSLADQFLIANMFIQGAASSATTSATSTTGITVPVWLNYPYVNFFRTAMSS